MGIIRLDKSNVLAECECDLCGYKWESIKEHPKCCPRCTRYDWCNGEVDKIELISSEQSQLSSVQLQHEQQI